MSRSPRKSAAQWAELVSEYTNGSESERDFCTRHGIKLVTLRKWRYHHKAQSKAGTHKSRTSFVKLNIRKPPVQYDGAVLYIGPDIRLECPVSYDVLSLAQLALAVHHGR